MPPRRAYTTLLAAIVLWLLIPSVPTQAQASTHALQASVEHQTYRPQWVDLGMADILATAAGSSIATPVAAARTTASTSATTAPCYQPCTTKHLLRYRASTIAATQQVTYIYRIHFLRL